ncbi:hypothetical protein WICPIJ_005542 [Wickerhamomyces pijperi]|uniref:Uncharacterized protein n=1 Tax=Wickerhamomyces pijperi TaxID=599730 RepID=A0A9P8TLU9_WICPI|nr:hypothetical protein WICPIJ_005542 [Wickerhamomyces pijperi]
MISFIKSHRKTTSLTSDSLTSPQASPTSPTNPSTLTNDTFKRSTASLDLPTPPLVPHTHDSPSSEKSLSPSKLQNSLRKSSSNSKLGRFFFGGNGGSNMNISNNSNTISNQGFYSQPTSPTKSSFGNTQGPSIIGTRVHEWGLSTGNELVLEMRNVGTNHSSSTMREPQKESAETETIPEESESDFNTSSIIDPSEELILLPSNTFLEIPKQFQENQDVSANEEVQKGKRIKAAHRRAQIISKAVSFADSSDSSESDHDFQETHTKGLLPPLEITEGLTLNNNNFSFVDGEETLEKEPNSDPITPEMQRTTSTKSQTDTVLNLSEKLERYLNFKPSPKTPEEQHESPTDDIHPQRKLLSPPSFQLNGKEIISVPDSDIPLTSDSEQAEEGEDQYDNDSEFSFEQERGKDNIGRNSSRRYYKTEEMIDPQEPPEVVRGPGFYINDHYDYEEGEFDDDMNYYEGDEDDEDEEHGFQSRKYFSSDEEEEENQSMISGPSKNQTSTLYDHNNTALSRSNLILATPVLTSIESPQQTTLVTPPEQTINRAGVASSVQLQPPLTLRKRSLKYHQLSHQLDHSNEIHDVTWEKYRCISDDFTEMRSNSHRSRTDIDTTNQNSDDDSNYVDEYDYEDEELLNEINGIPEDDDYEHYYQPAATSHLNPTPPTPQQYYAPQIISPPYHNSPYKHHKHTTSSHRSKTMSSHHTDKHFMTDYGQLNNKDKFETKDRVVTLFHSRSTNGRIQTPITHNIYTKQRIQTPSTPTQHSGFNFDSDFAHDSNSWSSNTSVLNTPNPGFLRSGGNKIDLSPISEGGGSSIGVGSGGNWDSSFEE